LFFVSWSYVAAIQFRAEPGIIFLHLTILLREVVDELSADSGLQLDLEIANATVFPDERLGFYV